jgi:hypothetical protein
MRFIRAFQGWFRLNNIARAEMQYQARMLRQRRGWRAWLGRRMVDAALIVALFLALLSAVAALLRVNTQPFYEAVPLLLIFPPMVAVMLHFGLIIRALAFSSNSIARERQQDSWDLLVLTGVDARQVVMGKWAATVRSLWPSFIRLGLLRACIVLFLGSLLGTGGNYASLYGGDFRVVIPSIFQFIIAIGFIFVATACNLLFTAACGVSASVRHRSAGVALARGIGIRLGIIFLIAGVVIGCAFILPRFFLYLYQSLSILASDLYIMVMGSLASIVDNGVVLGTMYVTTRVEYGDGSPYDYRYQILLVVAMAGLLLLYLGLTKVLLQRTIRRLVRQGVTPPATPAAPAQLESTPSPMV